MKFSFRRKILVLTLSLVALTQIATLGSVGTIATRHIDETADQRLALGSGVFREFMGHRSAQFQATLRVLASDFGFKQSVATGDLATVESALDNHRRRASADIALLLDMDGTVLVSAGLGSGDAIDTNLPDLVAPTGGVEQSTSVARLPGHYYQTFGRAVKAPITVGWVVLGYEIDTALAERVAALTGLQATFVDTRPDGAQVIASTLAAPRLAAFGSELFGPAARAAVDTSAPRFVGSSDDEHVSSWLSFQSGASDLAAVLQISIADARAPFRRARNTTLAFAAAALLLGVLCAGWLSKAVSFPVRRLADAAGRFAAGDYETSVNVRSNDELGALAGSFNKMRIAVSEREKTIRYAAEFDKLTGLANRAQFRSLLTEHIDAADDDTRFAIIKIEIAQFANLTATLGHGAGEALIRLVANRLSGVLAVDQTLARVEGAEFVVLLPRADGKAAQRVCDQMNQVLATGTRFHEATINLHGVSGIALFPDHGVHAEDLLRRASIAKADAQTDGLAVLCYRSGREDMQLRQLRMIGDLAEAIDADELSLVYQPKIHIAERRADSVEALVRWQHPELGPLAPDEFIGLAEQFGLIRQLTRWVIKTAIAQCAQWRGHGAILDVAVNLSARDLMDENLPVYIVDALKTGGVAAEQLSIEVTESAIMRDLKKCVGVLNCLRDVGVRISIDDFGTGHSSLLQLKHMPLNELKIDRSFVTGLLTDERDDAIVRTTIELAHRLNLKVVAEGIENDRVLRRLGEMGCEYAQGYGISRPLTPDALLAWKRAYDAERPTLASVPIKKTK